MTELRTEKIEKWYKVSKQERVHALDEVTLTFNNGVYGLIGANGAGKSTFIKILAGVLDADSGKIFMNGEEVNPKAEKYKEKIGYMPQQQWMYENMSCTQFLNYMCGLKNISGKGRKEEIDRRLTEVGLFEKRNVKTGRLSGGMKQRLLFAQALLGKPDIIILDEPTAGIDNEEREKICKLIKKEGTEKIVIVSTHIMSDIEETGGKIIRFDKDRTGE